MSGSVLRNRRVAAVAYDGQCLFELGIATELFGLERPELDVDWYDLKVVAAEEGPIRTLAGLTLDADNDLGWLASAGTVVLPGWAGPTQPPPRPLIEAIITAHASGARIMSICSGVFLLAATGLLDGKPATTHWRYTDHLAATYPEIEVRPNVLYIDNGSVLTSAGSAAGIDLGLHLIRRDHGADVAAKVARRLVVPPQRDGGQAQFIVHSEPAPDAHGRIGATLAWMGENLDRPLTVADIAGHAHLSPRTLARRFAAEVGATPIQWLTRERVRRAQQLLETTDRSVDEIAALAGFGSAETMRHHFRSIIDTTPSRYRATFAAEAA